MEVLEKLLDYVSYDTMSEDDSTTWPSTKKQLTLGKHLVKELKKYGCEEAFLNDDGYVYGYLKANEHGYSSIGLIAHMDTSPDASGKDVDPEIIENYDGKDIKLANGLVTSVKRYPNIKKYAGKTIVVTDGNTLLGADDKAGIAIIMEVLETFKKNKDLKHGDIRVCITPDEEVGRGAHKFNYIYFKVDYCYTIDGSDFRAISYENFNAASAKIKVNGISVHPGEAKDKMVNALNVAHEFHGLIDPAMRPEKTEKLEGFNHLAYVKGETGTAEMYYILRNFNLKLLNKQKKMFVDAQKKLNKQYGYEVISLEIADQYRNMAEVFKKNKKPIKLFTNACRKCKVKPYAEAIRGGTDGATLSLNGLPCPNLGTGGDNFHGPYELWCKEDGEMVVKILLEMIKMAQR